MARVGLDATAVSADGKGIARVQLHTARALADRGEHELVVFYRRAEAHALLSGVGELVRAYAPRTLVWEQVGLARAFSRHRLDAVVTWTERLPLAGGGRTVVWLFESPSHRIVKNRVDGAGAYQRVSDLVTAALWKRSLRRAAAVVTGSRATADDLAREVPGLDATPLYPGLVAGFAPATGPADPPYAFHLASSDPRDNTETVLAALAAAGAPVVLRIGGGLGRRRAAIEAEVARLGLRGRVELLGRVSDEELVRLYQGASVYLDATLYEGFGYQILEAMACGAPVVCSRASSIPEVAGDAALLCDPRSPEEIAAALVRVVSDRSLASDLRERGLRRAAGFTWERTARELSTVLERVLRS